MDLYGKVLHNVKQFIPQVNMAPELARNARGPRLLTMCRIVSKETKTGNVLMPPPPTRAHNNNF